MIIYYQGLSLMSRGYEVFLACVVSTIEHKRTKLAEILIVCDFTDIFLDEVPSLLPARKVEFVIDLVLDTTPISRAPYHMALLDH